MLSIPLVPVATAAPPADAAALVELLLLIYVLDSSSLLISFVVSLFAEAGLLLFDLFGLSLVSCCKSNALSAFER